MTDALPQIPAVLDLAGTAVFALTGALLAARLKQTFVTMAFFALVTGVGGGSVRDPWVVPVCLGVALLAWFTPHKWWEGKLLDWADALGLAANAVLGTAKALAYGIAPVPAVLMGVITGCVGGVIRDVLANRPSIIMRPESYVTRGRAGLGAVCGGPCAEPAARTGLDCGGTGGLRPARTGDRAGVGAAELSSQLTVCIRQAFLHPTATILVAAPNRWSSAAPSLPRP